MRLVCSTVLIFMFAASANAKVVSTESQKVELEIRSATLELSAKCRAPQFEDDAHRVYFSDASYKEAQNYVESDYSMKLLNKRCGFNGVGPKLAEDTYEKVIVLFVDGQTPKKMLEEAIRVVWESKN